METIQITKLLNSASDYRITIRSVLDNYEPTSIELTQNELNKVAQEFDKYRNGDGYYNPDNCQRHFV